MYINNKKTTCITFQGLNGSIVSTAMHNFVLYLTTTLGDDHTRISRGKKLVIPYMYNIHKINNVVFVLCLLFTTFFITETVDLQILCNIWTTVHKIDLCIC